MGRGDRILYSFKTHSQLASTDDIRTATLHSLEILLNIVFRLNAVNYWTVYITVYIKLIIAVCNKHNIIMTIEKVAMSVRNV